MSVFRFLYAHSKYTKSLFGDLRNSGVQTATSIHHFSFDVRKFRFGAMTFSEKQKLTTNDSGSQSSSSSSSGQNILVRTTPSPSFSYLLNGSIKNGLVQSQNRALANLDPKRKTSVTEGYYKSGNENSSNHNQQHQQREQTKCEFNFNSINVRLLETFGFIGAVAVGIDIQSRINEWMPYQNRRGNHDYCQYHHHHYNSGGSGGGNCDAGSIGPNGYSFSRIWEGFNKPCHRVCQKNDSSLTTIRYCGSCNICRCLFDKLLHLYITAIPSLPYSSYSPVINVFPEKSTSSKDLPKLNDLDSAPALTAPTNKPIVQNVKKNLYDDLYINDACPTTPSELLCDDQTDSVSLDSNDANKFQGKQLRKRKKAIFINYLENDLAKNEKSATEKSTTGEILHDSVFVAPTISTVPEVVIEDVDELTPTTTSSPTISSSSTSTPKSEKTADCSEDIAEIFKMASIQYADQLNNLVAISLMDEHRPNQAMKCWSSCEASSRAFFNMGVAYESARHAINAKPDLDRAHDCYALAASMGHNIAVYNLALFYLYGKGKIEVNLERGIEMLEMAASKGVEVAQKYCSELNRQELIEENQQKFLQKSLANLNNNKNNNITPEQKPRPVRYSLRPSASMFGPNLARLAPKHNNNNDEIMAFAGAGHGGLKRNNSAPNLLEIVNKSGGDLQATY